MKRLIWVGLLVFEILLLLAMIGPVCVYRGETMRAMAAYSKDRSVENHRKLQAEARINFLHELAIRGIIGAVLVFNTIALYRASKRLGLLSTSKP